MFQGFEIYLSKSMVWPFHLCWA